MNPAAFARLLEDFERAGVYHLTPGGMDALAEACAQADLHLIQIPLKETPRMASEITRYMSDGKKLRIDARIQKIQAMPIMEVEE